MKHQISIVGGQITPIFWGIKEKDPDVVHLLYTQDSQYQIPILESIFKGKKFFSYQIEPYDFEKIKTQVRKIIASHPSITFELNLTGGTKMMALACHHIFYSQSFNTFYIDQKNRMYDFSKQKFMSIVSNIDIDTFIRLSGHKKYSSNKIHDFTNEEYAFAYEINQISHSNIFKNSISAVKKQVNDIKNCRQFIYNKPTLNLQWNSPDLELSLPNSSIVINSLKAFNIAFNGIWWELVVADSIKNWNKIHEMKLNVELYSKTTSSIKNEIDIVINTGKTLIFIECKSGNVKQEDINKIRAVKRLYGGIASKTILVCKYKPRPDIIEKCKDLGILIFYGNNLKKIINKLESAFLTMEL